MSGLRAVAAIFATCSFGLLACGSDRPAPKLVPTPEQVRTAYGLGDGSCWKYRFSQGGTNLYATASLSGPNTTAIAGRTVYVRKFQLESGGLPTEDYFEVGDEGEVFLLRHTEGTQQSTRVTKRYEDDPAPPLFAKFNYDRVNPLGASLLPTDRFESNSTPKDMPIERHLWTVNSNNDSVTTPSGDVASYKLNYILNGVTSVYNLVGGFGFAKFVDFAGVTHQVCAARVCDAAGTCTGAASCMPADSVCP